MIRIVMVDDHELVRAGFRLILKEQSDMDVVAEAGDAESGLQLIRKLKPDVALVDVHLPGCSGLELTERIHRSRLPSKVVVLTAIDNARLPQRLLQAGAYGYLTKGCASTELIQAVRAVAADRRYLAPDIAQQLALINLQGENSPFDDVSSRELEVALMLVRGEMVKDIAERLHISPKTVSTYKQRLFDKLEIDNTIALAHLVNAYGFSDGDAGVAAPAG